MPLETIVLVRAPGRGVVRGPGALGASSVEGWFVLTEVDPGERMVLTVEGRGRVKRIVDVTSEAPLISLPSGGPVVGRVVFEDRRPRASRMIWRSIAAPIGADPIVDVELGPIGAYRLPDVPLGVYQVEITPSDSNQTWIRIVRRMDLFDALMVAPKRADVKLLLVVPPELARTGDVRVSLFSTDAAPAKFLSALPIAKAGGELMIESLPSGRYKVVVEWIGPAAVEPLLERTVTVNGASEPQRVILTP